MEYVGVGEGCYSDVQGTAREVRKRGARTHLQSFGIHKGNKLWPKKKILSVALLFYTFSYLQHSTIAVPTVFIYISFLNPSLLSQWKNQSDSCCPTSARKLSIIFQIPSTDHCRTMPGGGDTVRTLLVQHVITRLLSLLFLSNTTKNRRIATSRCSIACIVPTCSAFVVLIDMLGFCAQASHVCSGAIAASVVHWTAVFCCARDKIRTVPEILTGVRETRSRTKIHEHSEQRRITPSARSRPYIHRVVRFHGNPDGSGRWSAVRALNSADNAVLDCVRACCTRRIRQKSSCLVEV